MQGQGEDCEKDRPRVAWPAGQEQGPFAWAFYGHLCSSVSGCRAEVGCWDHGYGCRRTERGSTAVMLSRARTDTNMERDSTAQSPGDCGSNRRQQYQALASETHLPSSSPEELTALARPKYRGTGALGRSTDSRTRPAQVRGPRISCCA